MRQELHQCFIPNTTRNYVGSLMSPCHNLHPRFVNVAEPFCLLQYSSCRDFKTPGAIIRLSVAKKTCTNNIPVLKIPGTDIRPYVANKTWLRELLMGFQDLAFLPSRACFFTTFLTNCGRGESLVTTTCLKTVAGVNKGLLPVKYINSNKATFFSRISWKS